MGVRVFQEEVFGRLRDVSVYSFAGLPWAQCSRKAFFPPPGSGNRQEAAHPPEARSGKLFPTRDNRPSRARVVAKNILDIRSLSGNPSLARCLNLMLSEVVRRIKREDFPGPMANSDFRGEQLRRRCAASGWLSVGGFAFSCVSLQFDRSMDSPAVWGFYAMAAGVVGYVTYRTRHFLHRTALRRRMRRANTERIFLGGGIG